METLTTAEVAEQAGVNLQTVRYYERRGLLPVPPRRASGYRQYDEAYVARIRFIKRAQELGFTLGEIQDLLSLQAEPGASRDVRARTQAKIEEVETKIRDLQRIKRTLEDLAKVCDGHGSTDECPIWLALEGRHAHH
jgi:Hg(II)-responsive transcriptional regulator